MNAHLLLHFHDFNCLDIYFRYYFTDFSTCAPSCLPKKQQAMQQQPQQQRPSDSTDPSKQPDWKLAEALTALDELEAVIDEFAAQRLVLPSHRFAEVAKFLLAKSRFSLTCVLSQTTFSQSHPTTHHSSSVTLSLCRAYSPFKPQSAQDIVGKLQSSYIYFNDVITLNCPSYFPISPMVSPPSLLCVPLPVIYVAAEVKAAALLASVEQSLSASLLTSLPTSMSSLPRLPGAPPAAPVMSPMQIITHASTKDLRDAVRAGDANALNIHNRVITAITQAANSLR